MLKEFKEFAYAGKCGRHGGRNYYWCSLRYNHHLTGSPDVIMPPIGLLLGNIDFANLFVVLKEGAKGAGPYASLEAAKAARSRVH